MSWRLRVEHTTGMRYGAPVSVSFNEARMTPSDGRGQLLISNRLEITPAGRVQTYRDYWGTTVDAFDVHEPHDRLEVVSRNVVDTPAPSDRPDGVGWHVMRSPTVVDAWCEFLRPSSYADDAGADPERAAILQSIAGAPTPRDAADRTVAAVRAQMRYEPGTTSVSTTASEAWQHGQGVCQDISHVTISLLRAVGIPARYVSGYLYVADGSIGESCVGESHAWVEIWDGGWFPTDPTNGLDVGERHISVARGRDYGDVSPLKGIYSGGHAQSLGVSVTLTRLPR